MQLLEDIAKETFVSAGVSVPIGAVASSPAEAEQVAERLLAAPHASSVMVKALVPVGGRGKLGLVKRCGSARQAADTTGALLAQSVAGHRVESVLVETAIDIETELYVAIAYDAVARAPIAILGSSGGVDVEDGEGNGNFLRVGLEVDTQEAQAELVEAWSKLGLPEELCGDLASITCQLATVHRESDAELVEVNPLCVNTRGEVIAADAVMKLDPAGLFRQRFAAESNPQATTPLEKRVIEADAKYPGMGNVQFKEFGGNVGFAMLGGGASLMTLDALQRHGAKPANYSDISPGPGFEDKLRALLEAVLSQPEVRGLIYGWNILSFAKGLVAGSEILIETLDRLKIDPAGFPIVARIAGVGDSEAARILRDYSPDIMVLGRESSLDDAALEIANAVDSQCR